MNISSGGNVPMHSAAVAQRATRDLHQRPGGTPARALVRMAAVTPSCAIGVLAARQLPGCTHALARDALCTRLVRATRAQRACRAPPLDIRHELAGATQRAVELAAADPANRVQLGRRRELGERRRPRKICRAARRSSTSRKAPLPAGCQALAGRPGVLHGRQATLKDEHPSPTP